ATVPVGNTPRAVAVTPDGAFVYVTNEGSDDVSVVDSGTNTVTATIPVGDEPLAVAIGTIASERIPTDLTLKVQKKKGKDALGTLGKDGLTLKARLTAEGQPLEGRPIEFTADSTELCTETTDSRGKATCKVPRKQDKKTCYTATFAGDDTYEPSTATVCKNNNDDKHQPGPVLPTPSDARDDGHDTLQNVTASTTLPG
ncbi:hypothetical protein ACWGRH_38945, partial [Streptomyces sp. NPDC055709]